MLLTVAVLQGANPGKQNRNKNMAHQYAAEEGFRYSASYSTFIVHLQSLYSAFTVPWPQDSGVATEIESQIESSQASEGR